MRRGALRTHRLSFVALLGFAELPFRLVLGVMSNAASFVLCAVYSENMLG